MLLNIEFEADVYTWILAESRQLMVKRPRSKLRSHAPTSGLPGLFSGQVCGVDTGNQKGVRDISDGGLAAGMRVSHGSR